MEERAPPSRRHTLPRAFRALLTLRILNVIALATSLAALTGTAFGRACREADQAVVCALTTFVFGLAWAIALRLRRKITIGITHRLRVGWIASAPLAAANASTAFAIMMSYLEKGEDHLSFLEGLLVGTVIGPFVWVPCLFVVLLLYGVPIAKSQSLAEKGLAGEERGERIIGLVSAVIALVAFVALSSDDELLWRRNSDLHRVLRPLITCLSAVGGLSGLAAAMLATYRGEVRCDFVRDVEAGAVQGFRVDTTSEGKVLTRVTSQGGGYRAATFDEEVYDLDDGTDASVRRERSVIEP